VNKDCSAIAEVMPGRTEWITKLFKEDRKPQMCAVNSRVEPQSDMTAAAILLLGANFTEPLDDLIVYAAVSILDNRFSVRN